MYNIIKILYGTGGFTLSKKKSQDTGNETNTSPEKEQNVKADEVNIPQTEGEASSDSEEKAVSEEKTAKEEKPILPRKRKIVKNVQLPITFGIVLAAFLTLFVWKAFFNTSIVGTWYYIHDGEYTETLNNPSETGDTAEHTNSYSQRVVYEFNEDGSCTVTLGTMSIMGPYSTYQTEDGNVLSASVYYQYTPLLYGSYSYAVTGNIFTGRTLTIFDSEGEEDVRLKSGEGKNPLTRYEDEQLDERLTGRWKDSEYEEYFTFTDDGHMIIEVENQLKIDHVYTVFDEGVLMTKYYADTEQTYSYNYSFDDGVLIFNGNKMEKVG